MSNEILGIISGALISGIFVYIGIASMATNTGIGIAFIVAGLAGFVGTFTLMRG